MVLAPPSAASVPVVCAGTVADIRMTAEVLSEYNQAIDGKDKIAVKRKTRLKRYFAEFVNNDDYHRRMTPEQFKKEGNFPDGNGGTVAVWEFKAFQWRLYGGVAGVGPRRSFVGVAVDPDKKRDRADQALLAATAKRLGRFLEFGARVQGRHR
jgi:hypothetical protein